MRIAVLTFHRAHNCGAMLQAWALARVLQKHGHLVEFPVCNFVGDESHPFSLTRNIPLDKKGMALVKSFLGRFVLDVCALLRPISIGMRLHQEFRKKYLFERKCRPSQFGMYYDLVIVGSDQVWNFRHSGRAIRLFTGDILPPNVPIISYAASYGDPPLAQNELLLLKKSLQRFKAISVREKFAKEQLSTLLSCQVAQTLDPTLLLTPLDYSTLLMPSDKKESYLYMYSLFVTEYEMMLARKLSEKLGVGLRVTAICRKPGDCIDSIIERNTSPVEMVNSIAHADYVLAGSFHGTAIALVFGKKFLSMREHKDEYESRPGSLLNQFDLTNRLVDPSVSCDECFERINSPFPKNFSERLDGYRKSSLSWLLTHLK